MSDSTFPVSTPEAAAWRDLAISMRKRGDEAEAQRDELLSACRSAIQWLQFTDADNPDLLLRLKEAVARAEGQIS